MSDNHKIRSSSHDAGTGSKKTYIIGFGLSLALTGVAFLLVRIHVAHSHQYPSGNFVMAALALLAVVQLFVQLIFFLHLGRESKPRWNAAALAFAVVVVFILVAGSLWIMYSLNYHMMASPSQVNQYLKSQGDL